jgi:hypothetical protein
MLVTWAPLIPRRCKECESVHDVRLHPWRVFDGEDGTLYDAEDDGYERNTRSRSFSRQRQGRDG